jgi:hypothetical protein
MNDTQSSAVLSPIHPPRVLLFIAAVCIISGVHSLLEMISAWMAGRVSINLNVFGILLGRGLLAGDYGSRKVAVFVTWAVLFVLGAMGITTLVEGGWKFEPADYPWIGVAVLVAVVGFEVICLTGLRSKAVREWFELPVTARVTHSGWVWPLVLIGVAFSSASITANFVSTKSFEKLSSDVFSVNTVLTFADARTDLPVPSIGTTGPIATIGRTASFEPRLSYGITNRDGYMEFHIQGVAWKPVELTFTCSGYEDFVFTVNEKSEREVRAAMKPLAAP